ncbi:MAG: hemerythrin family protein [Motiliproteus sp.]
MPIIWQEKMSINNKCIDDEHKYLFCLINSVEIALKLESGDKYITMLLDQLEEYTRDHFSHEEAIQIKIKYPYYPQHKQEHQQILDQISVLKTKVLSNIANNENTVSITVEDIDSGIISPTDAYLEDEESDICFEAEPSQSPSEEIEHEVVTLLRKWVLDHVLLSDRKMIKYLSRLPKDFV